MRCIAARFAQWPVPHTDVRIPTCQGETFVIASGNTDAPPLVLFHGSGANSSIWLRDIAAFSRDYRVYAVDMIGEPGFSAETRPLLASDAHAAWLDDVWSALGVARASVVGVSLGGWLAVDYAIRRPHNVSTLSLIAPSGIGRQNHSLLAKAALLLVLGEWGRRRALPARSRARPRCRQRSPSSSSRSSATSVREWSGFRCGRTRSLPGCPCRFS